MYGVTAIEHCSRSHRVKQELKADRTVLLHTVLYTFVVPLQQHRACSLSSAGFIMPQAHVHLYYRSEAVGNQCIHPFADVMKII